MPELPGMDLPDRLDSNYKPFVLYANANFLLIPQRESYVKHSWRLVFLAAAREFNGDVT
jgi:hypothetical protein